MRRFIIVMSILILAIIVNYLPASPPPVLNREPLKDFPAKIGNWTLLSQQKMNPQALAVLKADDYTMRTYVDSKGQVIGLYIGWFRTQSEGKTNHSPRECLPGAGWNAISTGVIMLPVMAHMQIPVDRYLMKNGSVKNLFLFWYQGRGRETASEYMTKLYLIWDSITKHRTDGSLVRVNMIVGSSPGQTLKIETNFIRSFYPILSKYIPN